MIRKVKYSFFSFCITVILFVSNISYSYAQCAMCKATVENSENSETFAAGLNGGILYLMSIPYILFAVIAFMWYRNSRKNKIKQEKIENRLKETLKSN